jgi:hypothetical protein
MKRYLLILAGAAALCVPAAALADATPSATALAAASCKTQLTSMGATTFNATYGTNASKSNAMGKCVSAAVRKANGALERAAATCKAEQADANFAATHNGATFNTFYGGNGKGQSADANAYGKCVSTKAKAATQAQAQATIAAAKACKTLRATNKASFVGTYGTKANAFGKCVSATTKTS